MTTNQLLISIIVPCYKQAQYLDECLQSVLDQTYQNWECIIIDDGSPDETEKIGLHWAKKDSRFIYLKKNNGGVASARNLGIEKSSGNWILPLDGDDKIGKEYISLSVEKINQGYDLIYCKAKYFGDRNEDFILRKYNFKDLLKENLIFCSALYNKKKLGDIRYDEKMIYGLEDWEFWISYISKNNNINVYTIDKVLFYYRIKEGSRNHTIHNDAILQMKSWSYLYVKHIDLYNQYYGSFFKLLQQQSSLQEELKNYKKFYYSRRIQIYNKVLSFFAKAFPKK